MDNITARTEPPAQLDERDPEYLPETCRAAIERYPIRAIGKRPEDYMAHNLIRRTLYDARLDRLRRAWQKPPDWAVARVSELPGAGRPGTPNERGLQLTALHYAQLHQLCKIRCSCIDDSEQLARRWQRLWDCPPSGALYQERPGAKPCGLVHLCPWCRIRLGVRLWRQLRAGLAPDEPDPRLLRLCSCCDLAGSSMGLWRKARRPGVVPDGPDPDLLRLVSRPGFAGSVAELLQKMREDLVPDNPESAYVYDDVLNMVCVRDSWDIPPSRYDLSPRTAADDGRDLEANRVSRPDESCWWNNQHALLTSDSMCEARTLLSRDLRDLVALLQLPSRDGCTVMTAGPAMWEADNGTLYPQHRFRGYFLAPLPARISRPGAWNYLQNHKIAITDYARHDTFTLKIDSARHVLEVALSWQPIFLYYPEQWGNYAAHNWRRPLYVPCGAWRKMLAEPAPANPVPVNPVCSPPTSPSLIALRRGTRRRQYDRALNHRELLKIAKLIWAALLAEPGPPARGRPAHKRRLVELLAVRGIQVSGRPLRRLMAALKLTTE